MADAVLAAAVIPALFGQQWQAGKAVGRRDELGIVAGSHGTHARQAAGSSFGLRRARGNVGHLVALDQREAVGKIFQLVK